MAAGSESHTIVANKDVPQFMTCCELVIAAACVSGAREKKFLGVLDHSCEASHSTQERSCLPLAPETLLLRAVANAGTWDFSATRLNGCWRWRH